MSSDKRIALVTGSSSGIGRAEAIALAKAGYNVVINYSKSSGEARKTADACETHGAEILVCLAPPWADLIAKAYPDVEDVQERLWAHAALPVDRWPAPHREKAAENGRVDDNGLVHLVASPEHMLVMVCGGLGNLHALALHSFGPTRAVTRPF